MRTKSPVSQASLAESLGVSQTLVSQVLNGKRQYCGEEKYLRIWKQALRSGYAPKGLAMACCPAELDSVRRG